MSGRITRRPAGFGPLGTALAIFSLLNLAVFALISLSPGLLEWLWLSHDRPWGIVTSAFTHADPGHLANNLRGFISATLLFIPVIAVNPPKVRQRLSRIFLWLSFLSGVGANLIEYPLALADPQSASWGASGIVYGALGILLASAIQTLPTHIDVLSEEHRRWKRKRRVWGLFRFDRKSLRTLPGLMCLSVVTSFLLLIFLDPRAFFSAGPGVDVLAHELGFLLGFLGMRVLLHARFRKY